MARTFATSLPTCVSWSPNSSWAAAIWSCRHPQIAVCEKLVQHRCHRVTRRILEHILQRERHRLYQLAAAAQAGAWGAAGAQTLQSIEWDQTLTSMVLRSAVHTQGSSTPCRSQGTPACLQCQAAMDVVPSKHTPACQTSGLSAP